MTLLSLRVVESVNLQQVAGHLLAGVALLLRGQRLALDVGDGLDAGIRQRDDVEVLEVERGDLADVVGLLS